jgi:hypothetical protein
MSGKISVATARWGGRLKRTTKKGDKDVIEKTERRWIKCVPSGL